MGKAEVHIALHDGSERGTLVVGCLAGEPLAYQIQQSDILRSIEASNFSGRLGQYLDVPPLPDLNFARLTLAGLGPRASYSPLICEAAGGALVTHLNRIGEYSAVIAADLLPDTLARNEQIGRMALGALSSSYRFDRYRTREPDQQPTLECLQFRLVGDSSADAAIEESRLTAEAIAVARDLVNEPPNILFPAAFADRAADLTSLGLQVEILDEAELARRGFGALLAVGRGSTHESRLVELRWQGAEEQSPPLVFVGKGVTFDTGGISLKRAPGMEIMKFDMAGAACVFALMRHLATRKAAVNAVGMLALAENMPDGDAWKPGDVIKSLSGQTIEVVDTDAEGRMLLADALWHAVSVYRPAFVVDVATLTGAVMAALNYQRSGLHSNDDALAQALLAAGEAEGERLWRLPLGDDYDRLMDSAIADMRNSGPPGWGGGDGAGSTTAAQFLQRFVDGVRWAHLDIPGVAWAHTATATLPVGPTGFGVRLLNRLVANVEAGAFR